MSERIILDTSFVVDLEREVHAGLHGQASRFLEDHADALLYLTFTTAGELSAGVEPGNQAGWEQFLAPFHVLAVNREAAWHYGRIFRHLKENGVLIGSNEMWIAATGLAHRMPVVTRYGSRYMRVPGLAVMDYAG